MMRLALRYTRDDFAAKDLVHDTFLKVFHQIKSYKAEKGAFKAWISRVLINLALDQYRKQKRAHFISTDVLVEERSKEFSALQNLEAEDILELLQQLPEGARMVFNLHVLEGYKHEEIARRAREGNFLSQSAPGL